jgi:hypothetical protein
MSYLNHIKSHGTRSHTLRGLQKTLYCLASPRAECRRFGDVEPITAQRNIQPCIRLLHCSSSRFIWPSDTYITQASHTAITFIRHGQFPRHFTSGAYGRTADESSASPSFSTTTSSSRLNGDQTREAQQKGLDFSQLSSLIGTDRGPGNESSLWYVITAAGLLAFHRAPAVGELWKYISVLHDLDPAQEATVARRIREACLKSSVLVGFPRVSFGHATPRQWRKKTDFSHTEN